MVNKKHYIEVGTADSIATFRSPLICPRTILVSNVEIYTAYCSTLASDRQLSVVNIVRPLSVVNVMRPSSHRRSCQLSKTECDATKLLFTIVVRCVEVEQEADQLLFAVRNSYYIGEAMERTDLATVPLRTGPFSLYQSQIWLSCNQGSV